MLAEPAGRRVLLAPSDEVAEFVVDDYTFDQVELGAVAVETGRTAWSVTAPGLSLRFGVGRRSPLGYLLRSQPRVLATSPAWTRVTDPVRRAGAARRTHPGHGRAGPARVLRRHRPAPGHRRWPAPGAAPSSARWPRSSPEPGFGFGSTPERPSVTSIVTTVESDLILVPGA